MSTPSLKFVFPLLSALFILSVGAPLSTQPTVSIQTALHILQAELPTKSLARIGSAPTVINANENAAVKETSRSLNLHRLLRKVTAGSDIGATIRPGLNLDPCSSDADCQGDRICLDEATEFQTRCPSGGSCQCFPQDPPICSSSADCDFGEVCVPTEQNSFCISADVVNDGASSSGGSGGSPSGPSGPSPSGPSGAGTPPASGSGGGVRPPTTNLPGGEEGTSSTCIDAEALSHLPEEELVFASHAMAEVVCDEFGSCATRGHIVMYRGEAMMMGSYCEKAGCESRRILVNSPRYTRGRRIGSKRRGLEYTAFAARFETRAEERLLVAAVRIGL